MNARRVAACAAALMMLALTTLQRGAAGIQDADSDVLLAHVAGTVQYQGGTDPAYHRIFGRVTLPDSSTAVTLAASRAQVSLPDSSTIDIGATTRVRLGVFAAASTGNPNVVVLQLGALHFVVRHPAGGRANYIFQTPTSQIAVRGTDGYIVTGPTGTDFYCVDCTSGDVTVTVGTHSYPLATGEQAIIIGTTTANADVEVVKHPCANPAAIALSDGKLGGAIPLAERFDTTGAPAGDPLTPVAIPPPAR